MRGRHLMAIALGLAGGVLASYLLLRWAGVPTAELLRRAAGRPVTTVLGMHQLHPEIGYELAPGVVLRHQTEEFDVEYRIDSDGGRRVPGSPAGGPRIDVYGDSWTFGHGVEDDETYAAELQRRRPDWTVRNRGVMGYGTVHAMLSLERDLERDGPPDVVVYGFTPIHIMRNHLRDGHVKNVAGGRTPAYDVVDGQLVPLGLLGRDRAIASGAPGLAFAERRRTTLFVRRMSQLAQRAGARFVVVLLEGPDRVEGWKEATDRVARALERNRIEFHDLTYTPDDVPMAEYYFDDDHPAAPWHRRTGEDLDEVLGPEAPDSSTSAGPEAPR